MGLGLSMRGETTLHAPGRPRVDPGDRAVLRWILGIVT